MAETKVMKTTGCDHWISDPSPERMKLLPCLHLICSTCLKIIAKFTSPGEKVLCSYCNVAFSIHTDINILPDNCFGKRLVRINWLCCPDSANDQCGSCPDHSVRNPIVQYCLDCDEYACEGCIGFHRKRKHQIFQRSDRKDMARLPRFEAMYCETHEGEKETLYCEACKVSMCVKCYEDRHSTHDLRAIPNVAKEARYQIDTDMEKIDGRIKSGKQFLTRIADESGSFDMQVKEIAAKILKKQENIEEVVSTHATKLQSQLNQIKEKRLKEIQNIKQETERHLALLEQSEKFMRDILEKSGPADLPRCVKAFSGWMENLENKRLANEEDRWRTLYVKLTPQNDQLTTRDGSAFGRLKCSTVTGSASNEKLSGGEGEGGRKGIIKGGEERGEDASPNPHHEHELNMENGSGISRNGSKVGVSESDIISVLMKEEDGAQNSCDNEVHLPSGLNNEIQLDHIQQNGATLPESEQCEAILRQMHMDENFNNKAEECQTLSHPRSLVLAHQNQAQQSKFIKNDLDEEQNKEREEPHDIQNADHVEEKQEPETEAMTEDAENTDMKHESKNTTATEEGGEFEQKNEQINDTQKEEGVELEQKNEQTNDTQMEEGGELEQKNEQTNDTQKEEGGELEQKNEQTNDTQKEEGGEFEQKNEQTNDTQKEEGVELEQKNEQTNDTQKEEGGVLEQKNEHANDTQKEEVGELEQKNEQTNDTQKVEGGELEQQNEQTNDTQKEEGGELEQKNEQIHDTQKEEGGELEQKNEQTNYTQKEEGVELEQKNEQTNDTQKEEGGELEQKNENANETQREEGGELEQQNEQIHDTQKEEGGELEKQNEQTNDTQKEEGGELEQKNENANDTQREESGELEQTNENANETQKEEGERKEDSGEFEQLNGPRNGRPTNKEEGNEFETTDEPVNDTKKEGGGDFEKTIEPINGTRNVADGESEESFEPINETKTEESDESEQKRLPEEDGETGSKQCPKSNTKNEDIMKSEIKVGSEIVIKNAKDVEVEPRLGSESCTQTNDGESECKLEPESLKKQAKGNTENKEGQEVDSPRGDSRSETELSPTGGMGIEQHKSGKKNKSTGNSSATQPTEENAAVGGDDLGVRRQNEKLPEQDVATHKKKNKNHATQNSKKRKNRK